MDIWKVKFAGGEVMYGEAETLAAALESAKKVYSLKRPSWMRLPVTEVHCEGPADGFSGDKLWRIMWRGCIDLCLVVVESIDSLIENDEDVCEITFLGVIEFGSMCTERPEAEKQLQGE